VKNLVDTPKIFESKIRLQMLASLSVSDLTYKELKEICHCGDGNMATHTKKLIAEGYLEVIKKFVNNKPQTRYILTDYGRNEFEKYVELLNSLLTTKK
jgi:predicted transcriptional regulator